MHSKLQILIGKVELWITSTCCNRFNFQISQKLTVFEFLECTVQYKEMEEETFIDFLAHSTVQVSRKRHVPNILQVRSISFC